MPRFKPENMDKNYKVFEVVLMQWRQEKVAGHPNLHWLGFTTGK
jgi:ribosomal protein L15E